METYLDISPLTFLKITDILKVYEVIVFITFWENIGLATTFCILKMLPKVPAIDQLQPHDHTTLQTNFTVGKAQFLCFWRKVKGKVSKSFSKKGFLESVWSDFF